jgi:type IV secretion system protein VirB8
MLDSRSHLDEGKSFETILTLQKDLLAARAWRMCYFFVGLCILLTVIILAMVFLQEKEVVLIRVDNRTGDAEILSKLSGTEITQDEAISKFFASRYLTLREQYDYFSLQNDYGLVQLFSSPTVKEEYTDIYNRSDSPDVLFGEDFNIKIDIVSITISAATEPYALASIRFKKRIKDVKNNKIKEEFHTARIVFGFSTEEEVSERVRLHNPLGFKVVSYQISPELTED